MLRASGCGCARSPASATARHRRSAKLRRNAATRSGYLDYRASTAQWHADRLCAAAENTPKLASTLPCASMFKTVSLAP